MNRKYRFKSKVWSCTWMMEMIFSVEEQGKPDEFGDKTFLCGGCSFQSIDVPQEPAKKAKHINNSDKCWTSGMVMEGGREGERERTAIQWWGFWGYSGIDLPKYDAELQRVWGLEDDFPHFGHCCFWVDDMAIKMSSVRKLNPVFLAGTEGD